MVSAVVMSLSGSSPLARGKRARDRPVRRAPGIIPAGAGETSSAAPRSPPATDHPRWRGGNANTERRYRLLAGSSPLARGKHRYILPDEFAARIIPAGAGETSAAMAGCVAAADHPRWRGGNLGQGPPRGHVDRIIPAGAGETTSPRSTPSPASDHPRWRGGNTAARIRASRSAGSSPLARGKLHDVGGAPPVVGIIPAGAGETDAHPGGAGLGADHPRWRGGNATALGFASAKDGSSPLARGKPQPCAGQRGHRRIIPAGAGETLVLEPADELVVGSSPLARGKRHLRLRVGRQRRIIPAGAGETVLRKTGSVPLGDHPRWRGGNSSSGRGHAVSGGSSPLARGKHASLSQPCPARGIIPAGAGETWRQHRPSATGGDHPRWRGGNDTMRAPAASSAGSSPLARGKRDAGDGAVVDGGIIPAGAGETRDGHHQTSSPSDHPRWRGGNDCATIPDGLPVGSSPLARGKRLHPADGQRPGRIIPAGAGET